VVRGSSTHGQFRVTRPAHCFTLTPKIWSDCTRARVPFFWCARRFSCLFTLLAWPMPFLSLGPRPFGIISSPLPLRSTPAWVLGSCGSPQYLHWGEEPLCLRLLFPFLLQAYSQPFLSTVETSVVDISCSLWKVAGHCPCSFCSSSTFWFGPLCLLLTPPQLPRWGWGPPLIRRQGSAGRLLLILVALLLLVNPTWIECWLSESSAKQARFADSWALGSCKEVPAVLKGEFLLPEILVLQSP
jgi:hypothetical protein